MSEETQMQKKRANDLLEMDEWTTQATQTSGEPETFRSLDDSHYAQMFI